MRELEAERRLSRVVSPPDLATPGVALNSDEIRSFKEHGFFVKHALLDPGALDAVLDRVWAHLLEVVPRDPATRWRLDRHEPSS